MKRWTIRVVVFLILGAVVNVAVAWGCARFSRPQPSPGALSTPLSQSTGHLSPQAHRIWNRYAPPHWPDLAEYTQYVRACSPFKTSDSVNHVPARTFDPQRLRGITEVRVGWPMRSFRGALYSGPDRSTAYVGLAELWAHNVPYLPIWRGLIINALFYAAILWLLTLGPFTMRRLIRRRRGHCVNCGYNLRGAEHEVCPECGVETAAKVVE